MCTLRAIELKPVATWMSPSPLGTRYIGARDGREVQGPEHWIYEKVLELLKGCSECLRRKINDLGLLNDPTHASNKILVRRILLDIVISVCRTGELDNEGVGDSVLEMRCALSQVFVKGDGSANP